MKRILLTNDDGFDSIGLMVLREAVLEALGSEAQVLVVAPAREKSACGHGLNLTEPLRFHKVDDDFYKLDDGSPTDCIYLGLNAIYKDGLKPDLVLSGINLGSNMGEDTTYSGTVAGAMEAVLHGMPAMAFSQVIKDKNLASSFDFTLAREVVIKLVKKFFETDLRLGDRKFLNINIPPISSQKCKGYKITQKGFRLYGNDASLCRDPRGNEYYWLGGQPLSWRERKMINDEINGCFDVVREYLDIEGSDVLPSDFSAIKDGYVSITPMSVNLTSYIDMQKVAKWLRD